MEAEILRESDLTRVEVAPTKIWKEPLQAGDDDIKRYREFWSEQGIEIVALQALLFGRPDLTVFGSAEARAETLEYLRGIVSLGSKLGARVLVFGSPKNRRINSRSPEEVDDIAVPFFKAAGEAALDEGLIFCIEPNPPQYDCDFVTTSAEGLALVRKVGSAGFGLHLDAAAMTLSGESLEPALMNAAGAICHFHASEPNLGPLGKGGVDHDTFASLLNRIEYSSRVSVEMRHDPDIDVATELRRVLAYLKETYAR
jgi:sugar phosphate isomerase/epimerase